jgi:hypothetical protein
MLCTGAVSRRFTEVNMNIQPGMRSVLCTAALLLVPACGSSTYEEPYDLSPVTVRIADSPVDDALAVVVSIEMIKFDDMWKANYSPPVQVDLLAASDGRSIVLIDRWKIYSEKYDKVKISILAGMDGRDSWIDTATGRHALYLPDANRDRLVVRDLKVPQKGEADFTIDFDLRQSILPPNSPGAPYVLEPVLRLVDSYTAGSIAGSVASATAQSPGCVPVVYAFAGANTVPDDIDRLAPEPVTEGTVRLDVASGEFRYVLAHLPAGDYTVALTCQGHLDHPARDDSSTVRFGPPVRVAVLASQQARVDLP